MTNDLNEPFDSTPTGSTRWASSWPASAEEADRDRLFGYLEDRFGIPRTVLTDYLLLRRKHGWFLIRGSPFLESFAHLKPAQAGLKAFQQVGRFIKPTTWIIQSFGRWASRARIQIDRPRLQALLRGEKIRVDIFIDNGYVILSMGDNQILGLGLYIDGWVSSQLPRKEIRGPMLEGK